MQQVVRKVTFATLQTTNVLLQNASGSTNSNLIMQSVDVVALLGHVNTKLAQFRRKQIKPALKQEYSTICSAEVPLTSQYLFGDELAKQLHSCNSLAKEIWECVIPAVLSKIQREEALGAVVLPDWPAHGWYPKALEMLKREPIYLKARRDLLRSKTLELTSRPYKIKAYTYILQYHTYLKCWRQYCDDKDIDLFQPGVHNGVEFLVSLSKTGLGYSAVNTACSALSSLLILENNEKSGDHPLVARCMKGIFELKPSLALSLKDLTLKLTMLLCLTTGLRGQTIHKFDTNYIQDLGDPYRITVHEKLKQTKPGRHLEPIELLAFPADRELCVVQHLREYIHRTDPLRKDHSQLLLSYLKPFKPVPRDTVSRWVKKVLQPAGIDITKYSAHSCRASYTSNVKVKGLNIAEIMKSC
ncbi:hypothetical protein P5673_031677 [Acropora cervicornis]|uniref:Tyr recombinase domain-containing protein n=1 Tax=Acropora cervicornis TaxID=6130 RepID=A0AAD9USP1_ACRCE|nr:hypothetical protein P5673_031677 [Acropora cervicornis]